jgi:ketosteroid isomerase-like protein
MSVSLLVAAALAVLLAVAHSYLGERYILIRLFRRPDLPKLLGGVEFTKDTLRLAWHITSVLALGLAGLLAAHAVGTDARTPLLIVAAAFAASGLVALVASKGRHLSWIVFLAIASLAWWGSRGGKAETIAAVESRMRSFEAAERSRDPEALIAHFAPVPEFVIYNDGEPVTYQEMTVAVRATLPSLRSIEGGFQDLRVVPLGPDHALAHATFRETVVPGAGDAVRSRGAASWLWRRIDGAWRIVYGQVDHRPDQP